MSVFYYQFSHPVCVSNPFSCSPFISPSVQVDDSNTPIIRVTPIEDDDDQPALRSSIAPPSVFGLGPDLSQTALSTLLNTKEEGSMVDAGLLVKFLTDPTIINNLLNAGNNNNTTKPPPQHVNSPPGNGVTPVLAAAQSIVSHVPTQPMAPLVLNTYPSSCAVVKPLPRVEKSLETSSVVVSEAQCQSGTRNMMSRVQESVGTGTDAPSAYPMNITRDDYFKNLIREHGGVVAPATNNYKRRVDNNNNNNNDKTKALVIKVKSQKACMFFGRGRGCKLGESCLYLHDPSKRLWTDDVAAASAPRSKRHKFRT
ncbi:hypothetical protein F2Q69_00055065 [Brassica cretica]|uniref:C3H1-type domain-containing protein n=1 Tax=Brassica cretica TaxID=69181 RepID=A0A8S9N758_BRACR|nr:hypothetical protein F2Q69_00055065 [Brassica cretica]